MLLSTAAPVDHWTRDVSSETYHCHSRLLVAYTG